MESIEQSFLLNFEKQFLIWGFTSKDIQKIRESYGLRYYKLETLVVKTKLMIDFLLTYNFKISQIRKIICVFPEILGYDLDTINKKINDITKLGYSQQEVFKMLKDAPFILSYSKEGIDKSFLDIEGLGFTRKEVLKIVKLSPRILGYTLEKIKSKIDEYISLGFTYEQILLIIINYPDALYYDIQNVKDKLTKLMLLGYSLQNIIEMIVKSPELLGYSTESIISKIMSITDLKYSMEDAIAITIEFPNILGSSIDNIQSKLKFYQMIGLDRIIVIKPRNLIQSVEVSYARYMFFLSKGIIINESNYQILFRDKKRFEESYNVKTEILLKKYEYTYFINELIGENKGVKNGI